MPPSRKQHHAGFGSLTRLPSARYRAHYTGPHGLRRSAPAVFPTKTAAEDWPARTRADMSRDQWIAPPAAKLRTLPRGPVGLRLGVVQWAVR